MIKDTIFTVDMTSYRNRVAVASARMRGLYHGAQQQCAEDIGRQPITVSKVLRGIEIDDGLLVAVEAWLRGCEDIQPIQETQSVAS